VHIAVHVFEETGGWRTVCERQINAQQLRAVMSQGQYQVASFLVCNAVRATRRVDPPVGSTRQAS